MEDDKGNRQFEFENPQNLVFVVFLFHILFCINEDRKTISSRCSRLPKWKKLRMCCRLNLISGQNDFNLG